MCPSSSRPMPLTMQLLASFPPLVPMVKSARSLSIHEHSLCPSWTTTPMIRSYSLFLKPSTCGDIIWTALLIWSMSLLTTKTLCTFRCLRCYPNDKPTGLNISFNSTSSFVSDHWLSVKPNALTRWWDVYPKKGENSFTWVNPQNLCPVFTIEQLNSSLHATYLQLHVLQVSVLMGVKRLHANILSALSSNLIAQTHLLGSLNPQWTTNVNGFLHLDGHIYVPEANDLGLYILWYKHDHPLSGHIGQSHTLELVHCDYTWPGIQKYIKDYIKSCTTCTRAKTPRHQPYKLLKQLLIPERPWDSISMDFIEQLPSSLGFTAILVVVDQLSKQAIFVPTYNTIMSSQLT